MKNIDTSKFLNCSVAIQHYFLSVRKKYTTEAEARRRLDKKTEHNLFEVLKKDAVFEEKLNLNNILKHLKKMREDKIASTQYFQYYLPRNFRAAWNIVSLVFYLFLSGVFLVVLSQVFPEYYTIILLIGLINTSLTFMLHLRKKYDLYWLIRRVGEKHQEKLDLLLLKSNQKDKIKYWEMIVCSEYIVDTFPQDKREKLTLALSCIQALKDHEDIKKRDIWTRYMSKSYMLSHQTFQNILNDTTLKSYPEYFATIKEIHLLIEEIEKEADNEK